MQNQNQTMTDTGIPFENILVVPTRELFFEGPWQGLRGVDQFDLQAYMDVIQNQCLFLSRPQMEQNLNYKQIIPYLVFKYQDKYFLMQRSASGSETRLRSKFSLGIGGHIREDDMQGSSIFDWARREFAEEVDFQGELNVAVLGILNDDSDDVGKVHLGFVMLLTGDSDKITVKSELKSGELLTIAACSLFEPQMENWSKLVFEYLKKQN
jgi:predicted NUDIX family phosphoesterase